jgi:hypothetical protein
MRLATSAFGALVGGLVGGAVVVVVTLLLKIGMDFVARQATWLLILLPLAGLTLGVLLLQGVGCREGASTATPARWRTFPRGVIQADITGDVVDTATARRLPARGNHLRCSSARSPAPSRQSPHGQSIERRTGAPRQLSASRPAHWPPGSPH